MYEFVKQTVVMFYNIQCKQFVLAMHLIAFKCTLRVPCGAIFETPIRLNIAHQVTYSAFYPYLPTKPSSNAYFTKQIFTRTVHTTFIPQCGQYYSTCSCWSSFSSSSLSCKTHICINALRVVICLFIAIQWMCVIIFPRTLL